MKLRARLLLVYTALFIGAAGYLIFQRTIDIYRSTTVLNHELQTHRVSLNKIMTLEGGQLSGLAIDYSFWDEMVNFVYHPTQEWASENIDTGITTFGADAAWVYTTSDKLVYYSSATGDTTASQIALPPAAFTKLNKDHLDHFYVQEPGGLMEIRAATIVPTSDYAHMTPAQGYWLVGRYVNEAYLSHMSDLVQSALTLSGPTASTAGTKTYDTIGFGVPLQAWNGNPVAVLKLSAPVPVAQELETLYDRELILLILFFAASAVLIVTSLWLLVLRPLKLIATAIQDQKPDALGPVAASETEFGDLAKIVQLSFSQKLKIDESEFLKSKLEELNSSKSEFLAIAAHELRGPVGNINIFANGMAEDLTGQQSAEQDELREQLGRITLQAHKANVLINDMYQASKGGRTLDFVKKEFDFDTFIKSEVESARYSTNQEIVLEGTTGQKVVSDPDRLGQVMTNLIRNAGKYSQTNTKIIVRLAFTDNAVRVEVQDAGLGISPEDQPHLFERFYRSSKVAKNYPGLGLGLSVCKEIIDGLGGKIWFTSEMGSGSHFYFTLPPSDPDWNLS